MTLRPLARRPAVTLVPLAAMLVVASGAACAASSALGVWCYAFAEFGDLKYPEGFANFDFVNPNAPKGGTLRLSNPDRRTSFDKYNPFTLPTNAPAGVELFMFETLTYPSPDELGVMYGLLAKDMLVAADYSSVSFRIDPRARFNNGDPVTAADVKYSFDIAVGDKVSPAYASQFDDIKSAQVTDPQTVRFELKSPNRDQIFVLGTQLNVFSMKWGAGPDGKPKPFDQIVHEEPITTGPYKIFKAGTRMLDLVRDPNYWARDLGVRKGQYNFDHLVYHYYADNSARFEAFKAGDFDILKEYRPRRWVRLYQGPKFSDGRIVKAQLFDGMGHFYEGYLFNTRRPQLADRRVREALGLAFDWTWTSKQSFDLDARFDGLFQNTVFQAQGPPGPGELKLLAPYAKEMPPQVFGPVPPNPRDDTPQALRANLLRARALLAAAGWNIGADGVLRNARGEPFEIEHLDTDLEFAPILGRWADNLKKLGITLTDRTVDFAIYAKRLEDFDFDLTLINFGNLMLPSANAFAQVFGSAAANVPGSSNFIGIANPAIDAAIEAVKDANTLDEMINGTRVLDRVFVAEHYAVPLLYRPYQLVAYWNKFGLPATLPKYYAIEDSDGPIAWPIATWWIK